MRCASALDLAVVDDPTNVDPAIRRNRVRHELLPLLDAIAERDVVPILARQAPLLADEAAVLDDLAGALDPTDARALRCRAGRARSTSGARVAALRQRRRAPSARRGDGRAGAGGRARRDARQPTSAAAGA